MPTPVVRSQLNTYSGISPDDLNQLLGTHAPVIIYDNSAALIGASLVGNTGPVAPEFQYYQELVSPAGQPVSVDQPITMSGTILDRVELPISVLSGVGQDVLVGLYADSSGLPTGLPLVQTYVPKELIPAVTANLPGHGLLMSQAWTAQPSMTPPAPYDLYPITGPAAGFVSDGTVAIFVGGENASSVRDANVVIALMSAANGTVTQWQAGPAYPITVIDPAVAVDNASYVYVLGGFTTVSVANVYSALYSAVPPTIGAWSAQTALPAAINDNATIVISSGTAANATPILYSVGGNTTGTAGIKSVYTAPITSPGLIGTWTAPAQCQFPISIMNTTLVQINGYLVAIGGISDNSLPTYVTSVYAAPIHNDNTIGSWVPWPSLPWAYAGAATVYGNTIIYMQQSNAWSLNVSALGQPDPLWSNCSQLWTTIVGSIQNVPYACVTGNYLMNFLPDPNKTLAAPGSTPLFYTPTMSVPLHVTGLTNTSKYHIIVSPMGNCDAFNVTQVAMTSTAPTSAYFAGLGVVGSAGTYSTGVNVLPWYMYNAPQSGWDTPTSGRLTQNCTVTYADGVVTMTSIQATLMDVTTLSSPNTYTHLLMDTSGKYSLPVNPGTTYTFSGTYSCAATPQTVVASLYYGDINGNTIGYYQGSKTDNVGGVTITATGIAPANAAFCYLAIEVLTTSAIGEVHTAANLALLADFGYMPLSLFTSGKNLRPVHVLDDIINTQPFGWNWITYDYSGKPIQIAECILPRVNLIAPNDSNMGGPVRGTSTGWNAFNCALGTWQTALWSGPPLGTPTPATPSVPMFPATNTQQCAWMLTLTSTAAGDMGALTSSGVSGYPVVVGQYYTAFAYFEAGVTGRYCSVTINWYTSTGAACAHASDAGTSVLDKVGGWVQAYVNAVAPATAAYAAVVIVAAATGAANEEHVATCVSFHLDNSLHNGMAVPMLSYFEPGSGPGGMRNLIVLGYDTATSQLLTVTPNNPLTYFGVGGLFDYPTAVLIDRPILYYRLNDVTTVTADSSVSHNNGTIVGGVVETNVAPINAGGAGSFDGTSGYVASGNTFPAQSGSFTFEAWVNGNTPWTDTHNMVFSDVNAVDVYLSIYGGVPFVSLHLNGAQYGQYAGVGSLSLGVWHHVVVTWNGTVLAFYIDGVFNISSTPTGPLAIPAGTMQVGAYTGGLYFFNGQLAECAIYSTALSAAQVANHYSLIAPRISPTYTATGMTDTRATWPMNGLVGQVIAASASTLNASNAATTTATVAFNTGNTIILTAAGWSNGQPSDGSQYSIT